MGREAARAASCPVHIAAPSRRVPMRALVRWAVQVLSVVQTGSAEVYRQGGLVISREQCMHYEAGFAVPVLMS